MIIYNFLQALIIQLITRFKNSFTGIASSQQAIWLLLFPGNGSAGCKRGTQACRCVPVRREHLVELHNIVQGAPARGQCDEYALKMRLFRRASHHVVEEFARMFTAIAFFS